VSIKTHWKEKKRITGKLPASHPARKGEGKGRKFVERGEEQGIRRGEGKMQVRSLLFPQAIHYNGSYAEKKKQIKSPTHAPSAESQSLLRRRALQPQKGEKKKKTKRPRPWIYARPTSLLKKKKGKKVKGAGADGKGKKKNGEIGTRGVLPLD